MPRSEVPAATMSMWLDGRGDSLQSSIWKKSPLTLETPVSQSSFITRTYSVA